MLRTLACFAAVASAYELPAAVSRRALLSRAAAVPLSAVAAPAFADTYYNKQDSKLIDENGAAWQSKATFTPEYISKSAPPRAVAGVRLGGTYSDPAHSGLSRKVTLVALTRSSSRALTRTARRGRSRAR